MSGHSIMVIDDENIVGKMIKATFQKDGYDVETFCMQNRHLKD
jgi:DNA-binding response OmpR family regulator